MTDTAQHPNPAGLTIDQQTRNAREAQFQGNVEGHLALTLHKHNSILDRILAVLEALKPRDTPAEIRDMVLTASATAAYIAWEITLPPGLAWQLAAILPLSEPGATGVHEIDIRGLLADDFMISFTAGDPNARLDCALPVPKSFVLRVRDSGAGTGNTLLALRFEPARW